MKNIILSIYFLLLFSGIGLSQLKLQTDYIEDDWKGIKPLITNKVSVNELLGTPKVDDNDYYGYSSEEAFVQVNYSTAPCEDNQYKRGNFNISKDTVLGYIVHIRQTVKLSEIKFNRGRYKKELDNHSPALAIYHNQKDGIQIIVGIQEKDEYVENIYYRPSKKNAERFKCKD